MDPVRKLKSDRFLQAPRDKTKFVSVIHPQANGQAESANKVILNGIKKRLEVAKSLWAEQLHEVRMVLKVNSIFPLNLLSLQRYLHYS
jgi:hypothetical protein